MSSPFRELFVELGEATMEAFKRQVEDTLPRTLPPREYLGTPPKDQLVSAVEWYNKLTRCWDDLVVVRDAWRCAVRFSFSCRLCKARISSWMDERRIHLARTRAEGFMALIDQMDKEDKDHVCDLLLGP